MAIGPSEEGILFEGAPDVAAKKFGATDIEAQAYQEDSRSDLSSSDSIRHFGRDQRNHPPATGCRFFRGSVRREEVTGL